MNSATSKKTDSSFIPAKTQDQQYQKLFDLLKEPVLILSSRAGLGNYSAGEALQEKLGGRQVYHIPIEELISPSLIKTDFRRYRYLCMKHPFLLRLLYLFPFNYKLKLMRESRSDKGKLSPLAKKINELGIKSIIATSHRAAFWISSLKRRGAVNCMLAGFLTDFAVSEGWKYLFTEQVDIFLGAIPAAEIPPPLKAKYVQLPFPVKKSFIEAKAVIPDFRHVLVTGGGWGIGPIEETVKLLSRTFAHVRIHVICGDNEELYRRLFHDFPDEKTVHLYRNVNTLAPLMMLCGSVIAKPGGVTLAEAHAAGRKIFLLPGLPVIEERNQRFACAHMNGEKFSATAFRAWLEKNGDSL